MARNPTFTTVAQMVRATTDDASFADEFEKRLQSRRIVKDLMILRASHGLSQKDIAEKLACTQSRISKLESTADTDLRVGDLAKYADAVGLRLGIILQPKEGTAVSRVKTLAFRIKHELDHLAGLAANDHKIAKGVADFFGEAFFNLVKMLQDSAKRLPPRSEDGEPFISFEICEDDEGEREEPLQTCATLEENNPKALREAGSRTEVAASELS